MSRPLFTVTWMKMFIINYLTFFSSPNTYICGHCLFYVELGFLNYKPSLIVDILSNFRIYSILNCCTWVFICCVSYPICWSSKITIQNFGKFSKLLCPIEDNRDRDRDKDKDKPLNSVMGMTQGYQLDLSLQLRLFRCVFDNVILEHGELPCVLPLAVHLDFGHLPDNQGYLGLLSEPCTTQKI